MRRRVLRSHFDFDEKEWEGRRGTCAKRLGSRAILRVFSNDLWLRRSKSRLEAAGVEPSGQMRDEKVHAIVARSTFLQKNDRLDHFWKFRCRMCTLSKVSKPWMFVAVSTTTTTHYTTLHYTRLPTLTTTATTTTATTTTIPYTLHHTQLHYTTLNYTTLNYTTLHSITFHSLPYTTFNYITLRYATLHSTTLPPSNHLPVHQWLRSAIHASQQATSPIGFLFWNFRHRLVRYYWKNVFDWKTDSSNEAPPDIYLFF